MLLLAALASCATTQPSPVPSTTRADASRLSSYEFTGRIGVKQEEKGSYGNIRWVKHGADTDITLLSPLGQVVARIRSQADEVVLTLADNREYRAWNAEALTREVLGYAVPVSGLGYWLLGLPAPGSPVEEILRPDGLPETLKQDGWTIQYTDYVTTAEMQLPRRMVLDRGSLQIRLGIDQWSVNGAATPAEDDPPMSGGNDR